MSNSDCVTQQFPRISFVDPYWLQAEYNPGHSTQINYSDSGLYMAQMQRMGITHTVTVGDNTSLPINSPIKVFNENIGPPGTGGQTTARLYRKGIEKLYQVGGLPLDDRTFGSGFDRLPATGDEVNDPPSSGSVVYRARVGFDTAGTLLHGVLSWLDEFFYTDNSDQFHFIFRMKLVGNNTQHIPVGQVILTPVRTSSSYFMGGNGSIPDPGNQPSAPPGNPSSYGGTYTIWADMFHHPGQYEDIDIVTSLATYISKVYYNTDVRVQWSGSSDLYIDYLRVRDLYDYKLFVASDSSTTYNQIKSYLLNVNAFDTTRNFRWYGDEPGATNFRAYSKVSELAKQATGVAMNGSLSDYSAQSLSELQSYIGTVRPSELITDTYSIWGSSSNPRDNLHSIDSASSGTNSIQYSYDYLTPNLRNSITAANGDPSTASDDIPFWFTMQVDRYTQVNTADQTKTVYLFRDPTRNEIFAQAYLSLAYGAKGLIYFTYASLPYAALGSSAGGDDYHSLTDIVDAQGNPTTDVTVGHHVPNYKWYALKEFHGVLDVIGPKLLNLQWKNAASIHLGQIANVSSVVSGVQSSTLSGTQDGSTSTFVEVGIFDTIGSNDKYFMIVNRRGLSNEQRNIQVTLSSSLAYQSLLVTDVYSGRMWVLPRGNSFTDLFQPGQGKLYRVSQAVWSGNYNINSDFQVQSGATLSVLPGTTVKLISPYVFTVNGSLVAKGTTYQRITFTSASPTPAPNNWSGISCQGGGPDTLTYCDIKYAATGISFTNTTPNSYMSNDTVAACDTYGYGISIYNTGTSNRTLTLRNSGVKDNNGWGVSVNNAYVAISYTSIKHNSLQWFTGGLRVQNGAKAYLDYSRVENNIFAGISVSDLNSRASLSPDELAQGYNTVDGHGTNEIIVSYSGTAFLGRTITVQSCDCGETGPNPVHPIISQIAPCGDGCTLVSDDEPRGGWNNVYDTFNNPTPGALIADSANQIVYARYTYWGTHQSNEFTGPVDTLYPLSSPVFTPSIAAPVFTGGEISGSRRVSEHQKIVNWLKQLRSNIEDEKEDALDDLQVMALYVGPGGSYQNAIDGSWGHFLSSVEHGSKSARVKALASAMQVQALMDVGDFASALQMSDDILGRGVDDDLWLFCQTRKIFAASALGYMDAANSVFNSFKTRALTIDSNAVNSMREYLALAVPVAGSVAGSSGGLGGAGNSSNARSSLAFELSQNYPNPFNPVTTISYNLDAPTHVSLKVFNSLGQLVATLVDEMQETGKRSVQFDASRIASGVYLYKLQTPSSTSVKKMLILR